MPSSFRRILHIEDSETDAYIVKRAFRDEPGVEITWATTGQQGLQKLADATYDIILLDYALPDMTGLEVLLQLVEKAPGTPVVIVSGFGSEYVAARGLQVGAIGYVNKDAPHFREEIPRTLERLYGQSNAQRRAKEIEERIRSRPNLRHSMEDVLGTLRESLPEARGTFLTSTDGLPLAVSKRAEGGRDIDPLAAMVTGSVLRNLDMVGGNLALEEQETGVVRYKGGSLVYRRVPDVGSLVVVFDREAHAREDLREVDVAAREITSLVKDSG
ncbi:MAG: hypothetical protein QOE90_3190 [Thermoplasmata archaeon]|nr:hypothetical protein [Thermoplasmata archaeon]